MFQTKLKHLRAYLIDLFTPIYLFPLKLLLHIVIYTFIFLLSFVLSFFALLFDIVIYPFRSFRHFWIAVVALILLSLLTFSLIFNMTYIYDTMGLESIGCYFTQNTKDSPRYKVVRIIGDRSEGSGFFINPQTIITNFHVIDGEPSPKIIFPDGRFITPESMEHSPDLDVATLRVTEPYPELVVPISNKRLQSSDETPLLPMAMRWAQTS